MANDAPITLEQLFRFWRDLPHQRAAIPEMEADIRENGYAVAMKRSRSWFSTWSQAGKQPDAAPAVTADGMRGLVDALRPLLNVIYAGEGGYDSYNQGKAGDSPGPYPGGGLQKLSLAGVQQLQAEGKVFAVGAAQFIPETLKLAAQTAGVAGTELFNAANQDRMAAALLVGGKRPALTAYLKGASSDLHAAQLDLAKEWASIPTADGKGFYDGDAAGNRSSAAVTSVQLALQKSRALLTGKPAPPMPTKAAVTGLDPRGSEEQGMAGPKKAAPVKPGDSYLLVNDRDQDIEAYDHTGAVLWKIPCLARGQGPDNVWTRKNSDTPPGLYKVGTIYRDYEQNSSPPQSDTAMAYGWYSFDLVELEGQEVAHGRGGIMIHGGGTACGWPGAWAPRQTLHPTLGCIRCHNHDLKERILPLCGKGTVYVGVFQEQ
jgi:hypothetical protein